MSDKNNTKKTPATKKAATKKASQPKQLAKVKSNKPLFATNVDFEIRTKGKLLGGKRIAYHLANSSTDVPGHVDVDTRQGQDDAKISFHSKLGPIAVALYKIKVKGHPSPFTFESNICNPQNPVTITIPKNGKKHDEYKYSVVLFGEKEVLLDDPKIVIAN